MHCSLSHNLCLNQTVYSMEEEDESAWKEVHNNLAPKDVFQGLTIRVTETTKTKEQFLKILL